MKKKISLVQMDVRLGEPEANFSHAVALLEEALRESPDILVLPETVNVGFFPTPASRLAELADENGKRTKEIFGGFVRAHAVNLVAGSSAVRENGIIYNRAYVFDRTGNVVASYDKIHGFSPSGEPEYFKGGDHTVHFHWTESPAPWRSVTMCGSRSSSGQKHWKGRICFSCRRHGRWCGRSTG